MIHYKNQFKGVICSWIRVWGYAVMSYKKFFHLIGRPFLVLFFITQICRHIQFRLQQILTLNDWTEYFFLLLEVLKVDFSWRIEAALNLSPCVGPYVWDVEAVWRVMGIWRLNQTDLRTISEDNPIETGSWATKPYRKTATFSLSLSDFVFCGLPF